MMSERENSWFSVLRMAGAVTTTSGGTSDLFNVSYGKNVQKNPLIGCTCDECLEGGKCNAATT